MLALVARFPRAPRQIHPRLNEPWPCRVTRGVDFSRWNLSYALSARDGAADCLKKANPRRIHKTNLSLTGEKRGQADVGNGCPRDDKMRAELPFGGPTLKRERARRRLSEDVRKVGRFDVQASLGGQSVSEPGPVIQYCGFTTFGPIVDGIERQRHARQARSSMSSRRRSRRAARAREDHGVEPSRTSRQTPPSMR